jgi:hypothetical protein
MKTVGLAFGNRGFDSLICSYSSTRIKARMKSLSKYFLFALMTLVVMSCTKRDDKKDILGIWHVYNQALNGTTVGDGKDWIEFKADGTCNTRPRPGGYESGNYSINPDKGSIDMRGQNGGITYQYSLNGDSLLLTASQSRLENTALYAVRTSKYPITLDQEPIEDLNAPPVLQMNPQPEPGK